MGVRVHFYVDNKCAWQNLPLIFQVGMLLTEMVMVTEKQFLLNVL